jgi:hypothetical protein
MRAWSEFQEMSFRMLHFFRRDIECQAGRVLAMARPSKVCDYVECERIDRELANAASFPWLSEQFRLRATSLTKPYLPGRARYLGCQDYPRLFRFLPRTIRLPLAAYGQNSERKRRS